MGDLEIFIHLEGLVDLAKEAERSRRELDKLNAEFDKITKLLSAPAFIEKAAPQVIAAKRAHAEELAQTRARVQQELEQLG